MAKKMYDEASIRAIASAIRARTGKTDTMTVSEMAAEISGISDNLSDFLSGTTTALVSDATALRSYACYNNNSLTSADLPSATSIGERAFGGCGNLETVRLGSASSITYYAFAYATKLTALVIGSETVATLTSTSAFSNTPISDGTGHIYVPDALVDTYKAATNWATYASQILPISQYNGGDE